MAPKRKSAFFSATQEAQKQAELESTVKTLDSGAVTPLKSETVTQPQDKTVTPLHSDTALQSQRESASERQETAVPPSSGVTVVPSHRDTVGTSQSETVPPYQGKGVTSLNSTTVKKDTKVSFYLTSEEEQKLDDLAYEHKKRTGKRINRNDIVRHLIDHCSSEDLQSIE